MCISLRSIHVLSFTLSLLLSFCFSIKKFLKKSLDGLDFKVYLLGAAVAAGWQSMSACPTCRDAVDWDQSSPWRCTSKTRTVLNVR
mgnify:CR=1 FL=1